MVLDSVKGFEDGFWCDRMEIRGSMYIDFRVRSSVRLEIVWPTSKSLGLYQTSASTPVQPADRASYKGTFRV